MGAFETLLMDGNQICSEGVETLQREMAAKGKTLGSKGHIHTYTDSQRYLICIFLYVMQLLCRVVVVVVVV
jgi:hypothetical protein